MRWAVTPLLVAGAVSVVGAGPGQVFRSGVQSVVVDVSVMKGRTPLAGLTADDFRVTDNGVAQRIDALGGAAMPLDVSLVVDATWYTQGLVGAYYGPAGTRALHDNAQQMAGLLDPDDRLGVITFSATVEQTRPMSRVGATPVEISVANRTTWSFEFRPRITQALLTALTAPVSLDRRHVVLVSSATRDGLDVPTGDLLVEVASRADAVLYAVLNPPWYHSDQARAGVAEAFRPSEIAIRDAITRAAEATGGKAFLTGTIIDAFRDVLKQFRQRYVLRYSLQGVPSRGWHDIVVTVPSCPDCTIQARRGYMAR